MSDITNLFSTIAEGGGEPSSQTVDADLARGRVALARDHRKRTIRRSMMASTTLVAGVAAVVLATQLGGGGATSASLNGGVHHPTLPAVVHHHKQKVTHKIKQIKLVDYTGQQLQGFTVDKVPDGWFLSTSTAYALLIDPDGDKDNDPDAFIGKLAVLTQSTDVHHLPKGDPVTINGEAGTIVQQGKTDLSLSFNTANGIGCVIQAPLTLGWNDNDLVAFAQGVHITNQAIASHG